MAATVKIHTTIQQFLILTDKKVKFNCKEISINDEAFGCTLTFSEKIEDGKAQAKMTIEELMNSMGQYVMLQRTYAEDEFEKDYYYIETNDPDKCGDLKNFKITLSRTKFLMTYDNELFEITINVDNQQFENLKKAIEKIYYRQIRSYACK